MPYLIYLRMIGYIATLTMHIGHLGYLNNIAKNNDKETDPRLLQFMELERRFFTCWNFFLQIVYALVGLICDILTLCNSSNKSYKLPKYLRGFRDTLFSGVLWPSTWLVFTVFWTLFNYDRDLIFPEYIDKVLSATSNHIIHTVIIFVVLWEVVFRPREVPGSHKRNLSHLAFHMALYFCVLIYTYYERGIWLYPIFKIFYGTVYFPLTILCMFGITVFFYYAQWMLTWLIHGNVRSDVRRKKKNK